MKELKKYNYLDLKMELVPLDNSVCFSTEIVENTWILNITHKFG
jgi:hypothetical protein